MLSRNAKRIFRTAKKSNSYKVAYKELESQLGLDADSVHSACKQLFDMGLAEEKTVHYARGTASPWGIVLSERGRNRWRYTLEKVGLFFLRELLLPIIVSILTTLITLLLNGFLTVR